MFLLPHHVTSCHSTCRTRGRGREKGGGREGERGERGRGREREGERGLKEREEKGEHHTAVSGYHGYGPAASVRWRWSLQ